MITKHKTTHWQGCLKLSLIASAVLLTGCLSSDDDEPEVISPDVTLEDGTKLVGLPENKTRSLFTSTDSASSEQYIRNYLIKQYNQPYQYNYSDVGVLEAAVESDGISEAASDSQTTTSSTNTIENGVDEADLIKTFSDGVEDYLVTITKPQYGGYYEFADSSNGVSEQTNGTFIDESTPAILNLFNIDTSPAANLITQITLNENAYQVSGMYSYQSESATANKLIVQTSLNSSPTDWLDYYAWHSGKTGIDAIEYSSNALTSAWSFAFDGHLIDSRRIDNVMYVALRHSSYIEGLEYIYGDVAEHAGTIANNTAIIEQLDIEAMIPNITTDNGLEITTSAAFDLASCQLPNNDERFSSGSVVFNYLVKVNLDSGEFSQIKCILSEINQVYMNETSLFLVDSNNWSDQTSRLHRFNLADLSYDTSLTIDGTLGWRSAEFRIKELHDGTVVAVTSKPNVDNSAEEITWCCWFNRDWTHKLQLFQKDENQSYAKIAELPNESNPDDDDTPQSLGKAGEDIYGVRIDEDSVKVVTFEQTDPLYVFDISDRYNPVFDGDLEDSGFSSYIHNFGELILGVGYEANEWGNREGLKVELYKTDETAEAGIFSIEQHTFGRRAQSALDSSHHAFSSLDIDENTSRIAIPASVYPSDSDDYTGLLLFTLDKDTEALNYDGAIRNESLGYWGGFDDRAVIQHGSDGTVVHYIHDGEVVSANWGDYLVEDDSENEEEVEE